MFTSNYPALNNNRVNQNIVQDAFSEAIDKVALLTGLNEQQSLYLLHQQFQRQQSPISSFTKPILEHNEHKFIASLFH